MGYFTGLFKAARVHRTLTGLSTIMVPAAFADSINPDIIYLALVGVFIYAVAGIQNARIDNDCRLPKNFKIFSAVLLLFAFLFSLKHYIVFFTFIAWILLGIFYNTAARFILFGDVTVLSITHHALPVLSASLLLGLDMKTTLSLTFFMFVTFWFIIHMKNLKDTKEDKERGYRTLTHFRDGTPKTKLLFDISFLCMFMAYFIFSLSSLYLSALALVLLTKMLISYFIDLNRHETALNLMRLMVIFFMTALVIDRADNYIIVLASLLIGAAYLFFFGLDILNSNDRYGNSRWNIMM